MEELRRPRAQHCAAALLFTPPRICPLPPRNDHGQLGLGDTRSRWVPNVLPGFRAVHPDRTLRKNKRALPRMRPIAVEEPAADGAEARISDAVRAFFPAISKRAEGAAPLHAPGERRGANGAEPAGEGATAGEPGKQEVAAAQQAEQRTDPPAE
jgi:hypothetical protein